MKKYKKISYLTLAFLTINSISTFAQVKVSTAGNVAIGTVSNPIAGARLHVVGGYTTFTATTNTPTSSAYIRGLNIYSTVSTPDYTWYGNDQTGIFHPANNVIGFSIAGTEQMRITESWGGQVAIGGMPYYNYKFTVNGNAIANGGVWVPSDKRYKSNVKTIEDALNKVLKLNGTSYVYKTDEFKTKNFNEGKNLGFIAQEINEILPEVVKIDNEGYYSINYDEVIPVLVEAIKEQNKIVETQQKEIKDIKDNAQNLTHQLASCCQNSANTFNGTTNANASNTIPNVNTSVLYQNVPNPFSENTEIAYIITSNSRKAVLYVFDMQGTLIKTYENLKQGNGKLSINGGELIAGMYLYSLIVDGKEVDTKRMILTK